MPMELKGVWNPDYKQLSKNAPRKQTWQTVSSVKLINVNKWWIII